MEEKGLDGLVFLSGIASTTPILSRNPVGIPLVSVNCPLVSGHPSVMTDNSLSGSQAAEHLLHGGATRPAVIAGPPERDSANSRLRGFKDYLAEHRLELPPERVVVSSYTSAGGYDALRRLLEHDPAIDGVFCHNDDIAAGALNYAAAMGIRVPERLRVVGFDDKEYAAFWPIPITSFRPPLRRMGYMAGEILTRMIRDKQVDETQILVKSDLIVRSSSSNNVGSVHVHAMGKT
jgi:LacI family transcriptional regulator